MKSRVWLALFTLYIAWGTTYLAIRYALESIPPFFIAGTRFLIAGLVLYVWRRLAGDPRPSLRQWKSAGIIGTLLLVGGIGGVTLAEQYVPSGIAALVVAATPLWVVLINAVRPHGERPSRYTLAGVFVGLAGIFVLVEQGELSGNASSYGLLGVVILLLAALSWAIGSIYSQGAEQPKSQLLGSGMELLAGSAGSYLVGLLMGEWRQVNIAAISLTSLAGLGYLVVVGSLVGYVCYTWLLRVAPTSLVVTYAYVNPLVAVLLGSLVAGEVLTPRVLIATPLILVSVGLSHWKRAEKRKEAPSAALVSVTSSAGED